MPKLNDVYCPPPELMLGTRLNERVPKADQKRQRAEVVDILDRLRRQPGVVLADEVGMGKTFVALAVAYTVAARSPRGPAVVMVPENLLSKWEQDLKTFCELYVRGRRPVQRDLASARELTAPTSLRYGVALNSVDFMKLLDDPPRERCHLIFLALGAMRRGQTDKWVRLALIADALRRHGRGKATRLIQVKNEIHRFLAELLWAVGEERASGWGADLWQRLLKTAPEAWKETYNKTVEREAKQLTDDPVPKAVIRALSQINLKALAEALEQMPVRAVGGEERVSERIHVARKALSAVEKDLWKQLLVEARWRSPLLVMDEAHHLKNPGTALARHFQSPELTEDLKTGDGALAKAFDRMLFLTATPFQLGHHELVRVLERFGDVRWDAGELGEEEAFATRLNTLSECLDASQRTAVAFQRSWSQLRPEDADGKGGDWWGRLCRSSRQSLTYHQRAVVEAFEAAKTRREAAEAALRPWVVRHNKGVRWADTDIPRRCRADGAAIAGQPPGGGLAIPATQILPFFLAARSAVRPGQDLLGEALSSSYEAFRFTRQGRQNLKDELEPGEDELLDLAHARWYLAEFDRALEEISGATHPKVDATVRKVVDLWEKGEKVLVFAFYRRTCRALRVHISEEIESRILSAAQARLQAVGRDASSADVQRLIERAQKRYFDERKSPGRRAVDAALTSILRSHNRALAKVATTAEQRATLMGVMRRFLRVATTLARFFPLEALDAVQPAAAVTEMLDSRDASGVSWREKLDAFIDFLTSTQCSTDERQLYLEAAEQTQTGMIRVGDDEKDESGAAGQDTTTALANVQVATGDTKRESRARLMRAFNTPFFPDILVCSEVMGEGVDLQRFCRHVIHHDLAWNPSTIEQRTGRVDRLGCKAEGRQPIEVFLPYLAGTADERQYRVMSDREQWFRVVMGEDAVAALITPDSKSTVPLPDVVAAALSFRLGLEATA